MAIYDNLRSKHQKFENNGADMLNDVLPEELVSNILSRLTTKEAIKTSILSKRWRFLWTTISNFDFSDDREVNCTFYDQDGNFVDKSKRNAVYLKNFKRYVNSVMLRLHPTTSIDKFSISLEKYADVVHIEKWISSVVERNVKDLTLFIETCDENPIDMPLGLFDCTLLESLTLDQGLCLKIPQRGFVCFPNLKFLSLTFVSISGIPAQENYPCFPKLRTLRLKEVSYAGKDDSVMKLIRNCPLLEDVSIGRTVSNNVSYIDMCIPQLTTADLFCIPDQNVRLNVQIEAPIKHLTLSDWDPTHEVRVKDLDSLIGAELNFRIIKSNHFQGEQSDDLLKLFKTIDKVKSLSLLNHVVDAIKFSKIKLPLFGNVTRFEVELGCKDFFMLEGLLNNTENLQILVIHKIYMEGCISGEKCIGEDGRWTELLNVPKCLLTSLKRVDIIRAADCPGELEMIKNMVEFANVLEVLTTKPSWMNERSNIDSLRHQVSAFRRASAPCQFEFAHNTWLS